MINQADITQLVQLCLAEDLDHQNPEFGDITASLIPEDCISTAKIISREPAVFCGVEWGNEVFRQLGGEVKLDWHVKDGERMVENECICTLTGPSRTLLTGERTLLNIAQTMSAVTTTTRSYVDAIEGTGVRLLDTRKTLPGMRNAEKYAVTCGGGFNHRFGLYDAFLIKENHIAAAGSIAAAVRQARDSFPSKPVEVEVENLDELRQALAAGTDRIMLDNFSTELMKEAVRINNGKAELEASGNVNLETVRSIAETGVDFISVGALTKHVHAVDFSMRFHEQ